MIYLHYEIWSLGHPSFVEGESYGPSGIDSQDLYFSHPFGYAVASLLDLVRVEFGLSENIFLEKICPINYKLILKISSRYLNDHSLIPIFFLIQNKFFYSETVNPIDCWVKF